MCGFLIDEHRRETMQTGVLVEPFRRKRAKKNGPFGAVETVDKVVNSPRR